MERATADRQRIAAVSATTATTAHIATPAMISESSRMTRNICLFRDSTIDPTEMVQLEDARITFELLRTVGVKHDAIRAAGFSYADLHARGFAKAQHLRDVGMDTIDLCAGTTARDLVHLYGADDVKGTFALTCADVVILVGCDAGRVLGITLDQALTLCAGEPHAAGAVLQLHYEMPEALRGTSIQRLLDAGLRSNVLAQSGVGLGMIIDKMSPTPSDIASLGFGFSR